LHMAQRIPLPLTVSCFSKIQIGFTFLVPAHPGCPGQRAVKRVCVDGALVPPGECDGSVNLVAMQPVTTITLATRLYFLLLQFTDGHLTVHKCFVVGCNLFSTS